MIDRVIESLREKVKKQATGQLRVRSADGRERSFYLGLGAVIWVNGGVHPNRRWRRLLLQIGESGNLLNATATSPPRVGATFECSYYQALLLGLEQNRISSEQLKDIACEATVESLFDLFQESALEQQEWQEQAGEAAPGFHVEWRDSVRPSDYRVLPASMGSELETAIAKAQEGWQQWQTAGLTAWSPHHAPAIVQPDALKQQTSEVTYSNLVKLLQGEQTLLDLSARTQRQVLQVAKSLLPFVRDRWIVLEDIPDLPLPVGLPISAPEPGLSEAAPKSAPADVAPKSSPAKASSMGSSSNQLTVACVDDSAQVVQTMERIIRDAGYGFVGISDALRANAALLKAKPSLIFLDLVMPNTNGYELCTQLRKVSAFQDIPIIILTGKEGIIDRVRAKLVGASDYLNKPVDAATVVEAIRKYLPAPVSVAESTSSERMQTSSFS